MITERCLLSVCLNTSTLVEFAQAYLPSQRAATSFICVQIIFDVGHQAYGHKILTGRRDRMHTIRQTGGLSGW